MEKLQTRINNALEAELAKIYGEYNILQGDITPEQMRDWDRATEFLAILFAELIEQNK